MLEYLYNYLEDDYKMKKNIKKAFRYPVLVTTGLIVAFFILTTSVVPAFIPLFSSASIELPIPTKILFGLYTLITNHWLSGIIIFIVIKLNHYYLKTYDFSFRKSCEITSDIKTCPDEFLHSTGFEDFLMSELHINTLYYLLTTKNLCISIL